MELNIYNFGTILSPDALQNVQACMLIYVHVYVSYTYIVVYCAQRGGGSARLKKLTKKVSSTKRDVYLKSQLTELYI